MEWARPAIERIRQRGKSKLASFEQLEVADQSIECFGIVKKTFHKQQFYDKM